MKSFEYNFASNLICELAISLRYHFVVEERGQEEDNCAFVVHLLAI